MFKLLLLCMGLCSTYLLQAQGGFQRRTVEDRVSIVHDKMDSAFSPGKEKLNAIDTAFTHFYKAQEKLREELMGGGGRPDPQVMREKMQPLAEARDEQLKSILTAEQFRKWKEEIEPSLRPQRGPRN
jgi:protein CpxP